MNPEITEALCEVLFQATKESAVLPAGGVVLLNEILTLLRQLRGTQQDMQQTLDELAGIQLAKEAAAQDNMDWLEGKIRE